MSARPNGAGGGASPWGPEVAQAWLAAIVESSEDAVVSKTVDGIVMTWNRAAERLFGYTAAEAVGRPLLPLIIPPERHGEEADVLERILRGETVDHFETERVRKDGARVEISLTVSPVRDASGRVIGASKIARDISGRRRAEAERERLHREVQEANRAKDEFLAMLGHELRNPLGAVTSASQLLDASEPDSERAVFAREVIARQARHLTRLVDDLLDVSRVMTGKIALSLEPLDLGEAAQRAVSAALASGTMEGRTLSITADAVWVSGDAIRVDQILSNLLVNAVKFTSATGVIAVSVRREAGDALLEVQDDGIGMTAELQARVFELFVQGDRALDRTQGGLGIGLTLVERLARLHGGSAVAFSAGPDRGSRFRIRIPAVAAPAPARASGAGQAGQAAALRAVPPLRILLVEDNADSRQVLRTLLELAGHQVHEASDGPTGVEAAVQRRPHVALLDLGLPRLDGFAVAREIRARTGAEVFLVALTGYGREESRTRALAAGFDEHLVKPVGPERLALVLQRSLQRRARSRITE
jgi:PAS domain S-box-containing protein